MRCCLCSNPDVRHVERRFTGNGEQLKAWFFCEPCFQGLVHERSNHDPWILSQYAVFLESLAGKSDRRATGNQAVV